MRDERKVGYLLEKIRRGLNMTEWGAQPPLGPPWLRPWFYSHSTFQPRMAISSQNASLPKKSVSKKRAFRSPIFIERLFLFSFRADRNFCGTSWQRCKAQPVRQAGRSSAQRPAPQLGFGRLPVTCTLCPRFDPSNFVRFFCFFHTLSALCWCVAVCVCVCVCVFENLEILFSNFSSAFYSPYSRTFIMKYRYLCLCLIFR